MPPLDRLPLHVFEYICQYVPRRSLASLALTSRFCAAATTPRRFSRIKLAICDKEKLRDDLQQWNVVLCRDNRFLHVRRLVVVGYMPDEDEFGFDAEAPRSRASLAAYGDSDSDTDGDDDDDDSHFRPEHELVGPLLTETYKQAQHEAWLPFARFLSQLPALKDLVYVCTHQVPACLLAALHEHHPRSRLHVRFFSLRSLYQERDQLHDIDSDELTLATSPCLYSIHATCEFYDSSGPFNFNLDAIESMLSGAAPGLRLAHIHHWSPQYLAARQTPKLLWRGFFPESSSAQRVPLTSLKTLTLSGKCSDPYDQLSAWSNCADFSCLLRLEISCTLSLQALEALASMAAASKFRSLQTLGLLVSSEDRDESNPATLDKPTSLFLQSISHLNNLELDGDFGPLTIHAVLHRHGPTLRKLRLLPATNDVTNPENPSSPYHNTLAHNVAALCPRLEAIHIRIQRHQGRAEETSAYRALGALPRLRSLTLQLGCAMPPSSDRDEMIRAILTNCAVDATLARAIFDEVAIGAPLERLRIEPVGLEIDVLKGFTQLAQWVARTWVCSRRLGDGGQVVVVEEDTTGAWFACPLGRKLSHRELQRLDQKCKDVWDDLWPGKGGDWRDEWRSFPLQT